MTPAVATALFSTSNVVGFVASLCVAGAVWGAFTATKVLTADADARIAEANAAAHQAEATTVRLRLDLSASQKELAALQSTITWRTLSQAQIIELNESLLSELSQQKINVTYIMGDGEALFYADRLGRKLAEIGANVKLSGAAVNQPFFGLVISPGSDPALAARLSDALNQAGIDAPIGILPASGFGIGETDPSSVTIFVGYASALKGQ